MQRKHILIAGGVVAALVLVVMGVFIARQWGGVGNEVPGNQAVSTADPIDIVSDFYLSWLEAAKSTSTNPYALELDANPLLSPELRTTIANAEGRSKYDPDPVLCQTSLPDRVTTRVVSRQPETMRILVMAREDELTAQSVFTVNKLGEGWYIDSIACSPGEFEAPREFSFEKEGRLLKSVPAPLDSQYWHLVFEEEGQPGHFAPLFFGAQSMCKAFRADAEAVCDTNQFTEAKKVFVRGQMTETGVEVRRLEFLE